MRSLFLRFQLIVETIYSFLASTLQRVALIEKITTTAEISLSLNNFFGAKALFSALNHPSVTRLSTTLDLLGRCCFSSLFLHSFCGSECAVCCHRDWKSRFEKLHSVLSMNSDNGAAYRYSFFPQFFFCTTMFAFKLSAFWKPLSDLFDRALLKKCSSPFIPFCGLHFKDSTFINDSHPTHINDAINMRKYLFLSEPVYMILRGVSVFPSYSPDAKLQILFNECPGLSDDEIFRWSKKVEPANMEKTLVEYMDREIAMKKEIEMLKWSIELLRKENESLRKKEMADFVMSAQLTSL